MRPDRTKPSLFTVDQLLEHLDAKYPNACIKANEDPCQAHRRAGQRDVVDYVLWLSDLNDDDIPLIFEPEPEEM